MKNCPNFALKFCTQNCNTNVGQYSCSKKCFERYEDLRFYDVVLLGLFSRRFAVKKQIVLLGFWGCRAVRGFHYKFGNPYRGPPGGRGEGPMRKWSRTPIGQNKILRAKF